jgi:hypothetical protein
MSKMILMCTGFRRTGKDSYYHGLRSICHPEETTENNGGVYRWSLYLNPSSFDALEVHRTRFKVENGDDNGNSSNNGETEVSNSEADTPISPNSVEEPKPQVTRVAFADILKREVHRTLNLAEHQRDPTWLEANKDTVLFEGKTLRQHYIDTAMAKREIDPIYWARAAMKELTLTQTTEEEQVFVITDWRFPNEAEYINHVASRNGFGVITLRLFRPEVPIPPIDEISERALDSTSTYLLLVPSERASDSFNEAVKLWPQYANYKPWGETVIPAPSV